MKFVPFTVHVRVVPVRPGKRFEYLKDLAKLAVLVQDQFDILAGAEGTGGPGNTDATWGTEGTPAGLNVATPGGGQNVELGDATRRGGLGSFAQGTAATVQMGATAAQLMITGFYDSNSPNIQPYADIQRISGGTIYTGSAANTNNAIPVPTITAEVKALHTLLKTIITKALPPGTEFQLFRLDYSGIIFGDRGFTFPQ